MSPLIPLEPNTTLRRPRSLAQDLVEALIARIREQRFMPGDRLPTEAAIVAEFGVSRTVVREALSRLQAAGMVETRHGIGTFVCEVADGPSFRVSPDQMSTLQDVIAVLELRIGIETEAAALAALRHSPEDVERLRIDLLHFAQAVDEGLDAVEPDFRFHQHIAQATQNPRFVDVLSALGSAAIPRARLGGTVARTEEQTAYLRRVHLEHESIFEAILAADAEGARAAMRTHLSNSRERRRRTAAAAFKTTRSSVV